MRNILLLMLFAVSITACKDKGGNVDPNQTATELITLNQWKLERYTDETGQTIVDSDLNTEALFLYFMNFEFREDGEVRGVDRVSQNILSKGVWSFIDNETGVNVQLPDLVYDFKLIVLEKGDLIFQAPTGNFLSGVGERINLEFSAVTL